MALWAVVTWEPPVPIQTLHFAQGEQIFPMSVADFLTYSTLFQRGEVRPTVPVGQVTPGHLGSGRSMQNSFLRSVDVGPLNGEGVASIWGSSARVDLPRLTLPKDVRRVALSRCQESQGHRPNHTYYYRMVEEKGFLSLQYWFFYADCPSPG